jgi:hypothetical protein
VTVKVVVPVGVKLEVPTLNVDVTSVPCDTSGFVPNRGLAPVGRVAVPRFAAQLGLLVLKVPLKSAVIRPYIAVPPGATVMLVGEPTETVITLPSVKIV